MLLRATLIAGFCCLLSLVGCSTSEYNPEVDKALQAGVKTLDDAKRRAHFEKAMEITMADRAYIPIVVLQTVWAATKGKIALDPRVDEDTLAFFIKPAN